MKCRVCDAEDFSVAIDLKEQPWGNNFLTKEQVGKEAFYPLTVMYCHKCQTAQLDYTVKKEIMFSDHTYLSGMTRSLRAHFEKIANEVNRKFFKSKTKKSVLDIGSNDGTQLDCFKALGFEVLGVESSKRIARIANEKQIPTVNKFYNLETAKEIGKKFDLFNAAGVFFHLEELHSVTEGIKQFLNEDGVFIVQAMYMKKILENRSFDQIYHEHLLFYNLKTLNFLLNRHGLELFDAYISPIHGGSIIGFAGHAGRRKKAKRLALLEEDENRSGCNNFAAYKRFARQVEILKEENLEFLQKCKKKGKQIYGMGAPVKGNTLLNYFDIGTDLISHLVEKNELRKGLFSPGKHIPIIIEKEIAKHPDVYYVLAWNFKKEILKNNKMLIKNGVEFYFPINPKE